MVWSFSGGGEETISIITFKVTVGSEVLMVVSNLFYMSDNLLTWPQLLVNRN
jgi:hypothetical protein